jgi:hypothetical protein
MNSAILTRIRFRIALWCHARLLPFRIFRGRSLAKVLSLASPPRRLCYPGLSIDYILGHVVKTTHHPILMRDRRCLRQGILAFRFTAAAGHNPELHFGVDQGSVANSLKAHCWLVCRGAPILNPPQSTMVPIFVHRTDGPRSRAKWGPTNTDADLIESGTVETDRFPNVRVLHAPGAAHL